jgi:hypothetical protein
MSEKILTCPRCGLVMRVLPDPEGTRLIYDASEWQRRCELRELGGPALCLVRRGGPLH